MLRCVLPPNILGVIENKLEYKKLYEIRLRTGMPVVAGYGGRFLYLNPSGVSVVPDGAFVCDKRTIEGVVQRACEYSVYAYAGQLRQGYITIAGGVRIGVAGEAVTENGSVITVKNITGLNIRLPHEIEGLNAGLVEKLLFPAPKNTLIVSPPGAGKTTLLREIARSVSPSKSGRIFSLLIIDERNEIAAVSGAVPTLNVGRFSDIITNGTKEYGFTAAIRAMRPDIIITDELSTAGDAAAVSDAAASGVIVFASAHGARAEDMRRRNHLAALIENNVFDRFVTLSDRLGPGTVEELLDRDMKELP